MRFSTFKAIFLLSIFFIFGFTDINSQADSEFVPVADWEISPETVLPGGEPANEYVADLLIKLQEPDGEGEPVSREKFKEYLSDSRAGHVYVDQLTKYATPRSRDIQDAEHTSFARRYLRKSKINKGVEFLREKRSLLRAAEKKYGVAEQDIVSILMWETGLGNYTGTHRVFNIFMGQLLYIEDAQHAAVKEIVNKTGENPLDDPEVVEEQEGRFHRIKRSAIKSLVSLLRQSEARNSDPLSFKGSWGGALGYVQFMPFNLKYAVDGNNDGDIDLFTWEDAIPSVANYLVEAGNYNQTYTGRKRGIYNYNPSDSYMNGVIAYADAVWLAFLGKK